ncbi:MAG: pseudouridine-5'-phosphate glycosidase [Myxococcaceae bacterium]
MSLAISRPVALALNRGAAVVALETSVVAQGLPAPHNLRAAKACEAAVKKAGATPAAVGVLDGEIRVGLSAAELAALAKGGPKLIKAGAGELAVAIGLKLSAGTTVSATCEVAARAGIRVFATGGIGGVHRGVEHSWDVSQDLQKIAECPVGVVCAGAKSVLDLPKTLELLETLGVPVLGVGTREFPGFFTRDTGLKLEHSVKNAKEAAAVMHARFQLGQGGVILALPPPEETALPREEVEAEIASALLEAQEAGVSGKAVTPFLLSTLAKRSGERTLKANLALLVNNARFAGEVAVEIAKLRKRG